MKINIKKKNENNVYLKRKKTKILKDIQYKLF